MGGCRSQGCLDWTKWEAEDHRGVWTEQNGRLQITGLFGLNKMGGCRSQGCLDWTKSILSRWLLNLFMISCTSLSGFHNVYHWMAHHKCKAYEKKCPKKPSISMDILNLSHDSQWPGTQLNLGPFHLQV